MTLPISRQLNTLSDLYFQSKDYKAIGITLVEYDQLNEELSRLLKGIENGARDLLPIVSRIRRNLAIALNLRSSNKLELSVRREKPKFVILTAVWKREKLTDIFYQYYKSLAESLSEKFELQMIVAGSEGDSSRREADRYGFDYVEVSNSPLSAKWQSTADRLRDYDFDAAVVVGSDDFLSPSVFLAYVDLFRQGANVIGFVDGHFYNTSSQEMLYWHGYGGERKKLGMPERVGESIGMGRLLSREVLEKLNFEVWSGEPLDKGLDLRMRQNLARIGFLHVEYKELNVGLFRKAIPLCIVTLDSGDQHMLLDVKYQINVTDFEKYRTNATNISSPLEEMNKHFGTELVDALLSLKN